MKPDYTTFGFSEHEYYTIEIRPTSKCNYNCYYCTDLHINSNPICSFDHDNFRRLIEVARAATKKKIHVFVCGGEPTVYKDLHNMINTIVGAFVDGDYITVQSNMFKSLKWWEEFTNKLTNHESVIINGSYHNTQQISLPDYINKCLFLKSKQLLGMVSFGYNQRKHVVNDYIMARNTLGDCHCEITPLINASVDQDPNKGNESDNDIDILYDTEDMGAFADYGHFFKPLLKYTTSDKTEYVTRASMWKTRFNNFKNYKCSVSKHKIYVDWDGSCYKCFNEQFANNKPAFNVNNIKQMQKFYTDLKCMDCPFTTCFFDMEYEKVKQDKHVDHKVLDRKWNTVEHRTNS